MQAPTTADGGTAGQDPRVRACPACGAENTDVATFCWKCYQTFGASAAAPGYRPSPAAWPPAPVAPTPYAPTSYTPPASSGPRFGFGGILVAALVAVAAVAAFVVLRGSPVQVPESFGGLERISNSQTDAAVEVFRSTTEVGGVETDMSFYGTSEIPVAALIWIKGANDTAGNAGQFLDSFAGGFASTYDGAIDTGQHVDRSYGGITYTCAPITGSTPAGLCMWKDGDVFWILLDVRPGMGVDQTQNLALAAHDSIA